ncbi:MAG: ABC transporter substrate-binding protein [Rhodomicrobium sp.]|nr:MAG: ABC transporter substrate-binding protein [Rhodomicrobium sp.]
MVNLIRHIIASTVLIIALMMQTGLSFAGQADDRLVAAFQRGILSLDYVYTVKREYVILSELIDDGLFYTDPETLKTVPLAAKSYQMASETQIDVDLHQDIQFHDGSPFGADDVVYTFNWLLKKDTKTKRGRLIARWLDRVEKTGPYSVSFHLKFAYPLALQQLSRSAPLRKKGAYDDVPPGKTPAGHSHNGIGPYKVTGFVPGKETVLERFENYYSTSPKARPAIGTIVIRTIPDWSTQQAELFSGGVNWMFSVPTDIAVNAGTLPMVNFIAGPSMRIGFLVLDAAGLAKPGGPLTKLKVRQALNHAINREEIVKYLVKGKSSVIHAACHPLQFGCTRDVKSYSYDPARARKLLAEAGYPDGIDLDFWAYREKEVAEAIAADLEKANIHVNFRYVKLSTLNKARSQRRIESYFGSWASGSVADVAAIAARHFSPTSDRDLTGNRDVSNLMAAAEKIRDEDKRRTLYEEALGIIAEQAYWVPLYAFTLNYLTSPDIVFTPPRDGFPRLHKIRWRQTSASLLSR